MAERSTSPGLGHQALSGWLKKLLGGRNGDSSLRENVEELLDEFEASEHHLNAPQRVGAVQPMSARPGLEIVAGAVAHFYWEVYGTEAGTPPTGGLRIVFEVLDVRQERVAVQRLGALARDAARARSAMDVSYDVTAPQGEGPLGFGLSVLLPADAVGVHIARVTVNDLARGTTHSAERAFFARSPLR